MSTLRAFFLILVAFVTTGCGDSLTQEVTWWTERISVMNTYTDADSSWEGHVQKNCYWFAEDDTIRVTIEVKHIDGRIEPTRVIIRWFECPAKSMTVQLKKDTPRAVKVALADQLRKQRHRVTQRLDAVGLKV